MPAALIPALAIVLALNGCRSKNDLCSRAVDHVFAQTVFGEVSEGEREALKHVRSVTLAKCRSDGLSRAQADCIFSARGRYWDEQLKACPAFKAAPVAWIIVRPDRDDRIRMLGKTPSPDGPRHGPVSYRHLVGKFETTCGLTSDGTIQCWGEKVAVPSGTFEQLRWSDAFLCGLGRDGLVVCATDQDLPATRVAQDPLRDFDIAGYVGCGVRRSDGSLVCWNHLDDAGLQPPAGRFVQVALDLQHACALGIDKKVTCFGTAAPVPPSDVKIQVLVPGSSCGITSDGAVRCWDPRIDHVAAPPGPFISLGCEGTACCGIRADQRLACWAQPHDLLEPPSGTFTRVGVFRGHACAVRAEGGTICWGDNDAGQCNVPQNATGHRWY